MKHGRQELHESETDESSDEDDKLNPRFWQRPIDFKNLPEPVRHAIELSELRAKHSQFYYKLKDLNAKIKIYRNIFDERQPYYYTQYRLKRLQEKQAK